MKEAFAIPPIAPSLDRTRIVVFFAGFGRSGTFPIYTHIHQGAGIPVVAGSSIAYFLKRAAALSIAFVFRAWIVVVAFHRGGAHADAFGGAGLFGGTRVAIIATFSLVSLVDAFPIQAGVHGAWGIVIAIKCVAGVEKSSFSR